MPKILVTGSEGQVGTEIKKLAVQKQINIIATTKKELDITKLNNIEDVIIKSRPAIIINAAAYTAVDKAEEEIDKTFLINSDGTANLAQVCRNAGIPLLHISTDYVFDGTKKESYKETDTPSPESIYGKSKLYGEEAIRSTLDKHIILRTSWVFSSRGQNFPKTMLRLANERNILNIVDDQFGAPTWAGDIANVMLDIANNHIKKQKTNWGVYHYTGMPNTNWFEFANKIIEQAIKTGIQKKAPNINAISSKEYPTAAKRPMNSVMDCKKIQEEFGIAQADWNIGLNRVLNDWKIL